MGWVGGEGVGGVRGSLNGRENPALGALTTS